MATNVRASVESYVSLTVADQIRTMIRTDTLRRKTPSTMSDGTANSSMTRNVTLYPWYKFLQSLIFWQAVWFLYFQSELSASEAILLYAVYDIGTTLLEVPSGYLSDRLGRRLTLIISALAGLLGVILLVIGGSFQIFALAQVLLGASSAFSSGTDNALLYESLTALKREAELEAQELRAWRHAFAALAISAFLGGAMMLHTDILPFVASALAAGGVFIVVLNFKEPINDTYSVARSEGYVQLASLKSAFTHPVLVWLFALSVIMYVFSHVPFVFGQPFILEALKHTGLSGEAPLISGSVTALMMVVSVITSLFALKMRNRFGLTQILLFAFGLQIVLSGTLAFTSEAVVIALLLLRMVPDSLSRPFLMARIQPLLNDNSRATYLSIKSLCGRLIFAGTLAFAATATTSEKTMSYEDIQQVLTWYALAGVVCFILLVITAQSTKIDDREHGSGKD